MAWFFKSKYYWSLLDLMASIGEKAISILAGNLNLITAVVLFWRNSENQMILFSNIIIVQLLLVA